MDRAQRVRSGEGTRKDEEGGEEKGMPIRTTTKYYLQPPVRINPERTLSLPRKDSHDMTLGDSFYLPHGH